MDTPIRARDIRDAVASGRVSAVDICRAALDRISARNPPLNAFRAIAPERALTRAAELDARPDRATLPLLGVPVALKDNMCTRGIATTASSRILDGYMPPYDATVVERLEAAGALGSDTGGSIRQPAALCGVVGLMPTYGRVSRYGLIAFASSLDRIGPLTRTAKDAAILLGQMAGRDPLDSTSADVLVDNYIATIEQPVRGLRLGVPPEYFGEGLDAEVRTAVEAAIQALAKAGCEVTPVSLPHTKYAIATYYLVATAEASSNLARYDGVRYGYRTPQARTLAEMYRRSREEGFGPEVKRRIMLGTYALSSGYYDAYYSKAQRVRTLMANDFKEVFKQVDLIAAPTTPTPPFRFGEKTNDPVAMYLSDVFTIPSNMAGNASVSIPCGLSAKGLPLGFQLIADQFADKILLSVARAYENARPFPALP